MLLRHLKMTQKHFCTFSTLSLESKCLLDNGISVMVTGIFLVMLTSRVLQPEQNFMQELQQNQCYFYVLKDCNSFIWLLYIFIVTQSSETQVTYSGLFNSCHLHVFMYLWALEKNFKLISHCYECLWPVWHNASLCCWYLCSSVSVCVCVQKN